MALRIFGWICRLLLGVVFVIAGYTKLQNLFMFEMAVDAYRILPPWGVIIVARGLPWLEVALGLLLLSGWMMRYVASFTSLLLGVFVGMMAYNYSRGVEASCGCFGFGEKIGPLTLARDASFLAMALFLAVYFWLPRKRKPAAGAYSEEPPASGILDSRL